MIIDFRLRPPARGFLNLSLFRDVQRSARMRRCFGMEQAPSTARRSPELLLQEMDAAGSSYGVVPGRRAYEFLGGVPNEDICAILEDYPNRFIGVAGIDPSDKSQAIDEIDRFVVNGPLRGVGMEPGLLPVPMYPNDRRIYPIIKNVKQRASLSCSWLGAATVLTPATAIPWSSTRLRRTFPTSPSSTHMAATPG